MRLRLALSISVLLGFCSCSVFVSATPQPQWVWNPEAASGPGPQGGEGSASENRVVFSSQESDSDKNKKKIEVEVVDTQPRLFPTIISALSNSLAGAGYRSGGSSSSSSSNSGTDSSSSGHFPGGGSSNNGGSSSGGSQGGHGSSNGGSNSNSGTSASCTGSGGSCTCTGSASGACIGAAIASQAIEQGTNTGNNLANNPSVFGNFLQNIFGGSAGTTLPANIGSIGSGGFNKEPVVTGSCTCVDSNSCFLPSKPTGNCDGGSRVRCCSTSRGTRTVFPDEEDRYGNSINSIRTVTRSQIRRQLFRNIVRGSGSLVDDTLDLLLTPFLTKEDQVRVATRVLGE